MIDLHSHLLVNLDDGSRSVSRSVKVLGVFRDHGVAGVVCTPHVRASELAEHGEAKIVARDQTLAMLADASPGVRLYPGFEIMLDQPLPAAATGDRRLALAGSRYYLVEFPLGVAPELTSAVLGRLTAAGVVPVVAHPERYDGCTVETVRGWKAAGCAVQVDATTLTRATQRGKRARELVAEGLADVLAADNHGDSRGMWVGYQWVTRGQQGTQAATMLCETNPARVIADEPLEPVPAVNTPVSLFQRLRENWS